MKRIFVLILIIIALSGCSPAIFVMPDDMEFMKVVQELDTPEKIGQYMKDNFEYKANLIYTKTPYQLWKTKIGDCSDFTSFGMFVANYHGYETYLANIHFRGSITYHTIAIYKEDGKYNFTNNQKYISVEKNDLREIIYMYFYYYPQKALKSYEIYDYDMNHIMGGNY